jgi:hypothetical protein
VRDPWGGVWELDFAIFRKEEDVHGTACFGRR